jgi:hypothetical protein
MRVLILLIAVIAFGAMLLVDPAALVRLTVFCVTGGCGVRPTWIALGVGVAVLAAVLLRLRQPRPREAVAKKARHGLPRKKVGSGEIRKREKSRPTATPTRKPKAR